MITRASGTFDVELKPQGPQDKADGATLARMSIDKQFHGDLEAVSKGEMLSAMTDVMGSAGYVVAYAGTADTPASFVGAKRGSHALEPLPVPAEYNHGVAVEADFIAAIRGERKPARAIPRFDDAMRLLQFGEVWRESTDKGCWRDLPA